MTEDEARQKWCPFTRVASAIGGSYNRDTQGVPPIVDRCIASECMAWRSYEAYVSNETNPVQRDLTTIGYCGLAGKP